MNERLLMEAIQRQHDELSSEVARNRLGATLSAGSRPRWRRIIGRVVTSIGRLIEGD